MALLDVLMRTAGGSAHWRARHAAVVIKSGSVLSIKSNSKSEHAEIRALSRVSVEKRSKLIVWSIRILADGTLGTAYPCESCLSYLRENGVKLVFSSNSEGAIERIKL